jgi:hypothetical protein
VSHSRRAKTSFSSRQDEMTHSLHSINLRKTDRVMRRPRLFVRVLVYDVVSRLKHLPDFMKFRAILQKKARFSWKSVQYQSTLLTFHKTVPSVWEFRENRRKGSCDPLAGLKCRRTVKPCDTYKVKKALVKSALLHHWVHHFLVLLQVWRNLFTARYELDL